MKREEEKAGGRVRVGGGQGETRQDLARGPRQRMRKGSRQEGHGTRAGPANVGRRDFNKPPGRKIMISAWLQGHIFSKFESDLPHGTIPLGGLSPRLLM